MAVSSRNLVVDRPVLLRAARGKKHRHRASKKQTRLQETRLTRNKTNKKQDKLINLIPILFVHQGVLAFRYLIMVPHLGPWCKYSVK